MFGEPDGDQSSAPERRGRKMAALGKKGGITKRHPMRATPLVLSSNSVYNMLPYTRKLRLRGSRGDEELLEMHTEPNI